MRDTPSEPVKDRLASLEAAFTILKLSVAIYPPGGWLHHPPPPTNGESSASDTDTFDWATRVGLCQWAWRAISELGEDKDEKRESNLALDPC